MCDVREEQVELLRRDADFFNAKEVDKLSAASIFSNVIVISFKETAGEARAWSSIWNRAPSLSFREENAKHSFNNKSCKNLDLDFDLDFIEFIDFLEFIEFIECLAFDDVDDVDDDE